MEQKDKSKIRFNIISAMVYLIGLVLIFQLFNLQVVNGADYRAKSNTRLTRETKIEAARGDLTDSSGNKLVTTQMGFDLEIYKTKVDDEVLNDAILNLIHILEQSGDTWIDNLPISIEPYAFSQQSEEEQKKWKKQYKIDENKTAEQAFQAMKEKYHIQVEDPKEARKIMSVRYEISRNGYSNTKTVIIAKNISRESEQQIREQNAKFPGLTIVTKPIIDYTSTTLASHILGQMGRIDPDELKGKEDIYDADDLIGKTGIEKVFEEYLKGKDGIKQIDMTVDGTVTEEYIVEEAVAGSDVVLTIDANLQKVAEDALKANIQKIANGGFSDQSNADAGALVVMKVDTGEVLAMASYPDYEPELFVTGISKEKNAEYQNAGTAPLLNRAISGVYAPGSTYKMISAITGLETGAIKINEKINDVGIYPRGHNPKCWYYSSYRKGHGYLNVTDAIKKSCNYFFYETGYRVGIENLYKYSTYFGLGQKTGIELPSEKAGNVSHAENVPNGGQWYLSDTLSSVIGQSYNEFTPIQMAKYISMLVNGGRNIDVTLVKNIRNADGTEVPREEINKFVDQKLGETQKLEQLSINPDNLQAILEGMKGVTSEAGGTAYSYFRDFNIEIGGKTGSAQAARNGVEITNAWFVGFAPYDNPEIAVVVLVENGGHGGYTAEAARDVIAQYFGMNETQINENTNAIPNTQLIR